MGGGAEIDCYASLSNDASELSQYGTDLKYNMSGSNIPYNVCLDTPVVDYSLFNWAQLTYPSTYKTMTTNDFINSGIPNKKVLKGCNNASNCFNECQAITEAPFNITSNKCYDMSYAFRNCINLSIPPIIPEGVTNMWDTFSRCSNLSSTPVIPNSVINMQGTFYQTNITSAPIIPENVDDMHGTFQACHNLTSAPVIPNSVTDMSFTFYGCSNLTSAPVIPNSVTNMYGTFSYCSNLTSAPQIPNNVIDMTGTFASCFNLIKPPVIPNNVTNMWFTFRECYNLTSAPVIPDSVINLRTTFRNCWNLILPIIIGNNVTDMDWTFQRVYNLQGDIYIYSNSVTNCYDCFSEHSSSYRINLYVHPGTTTYSSFYSYLGGTYNSALNIQLKTF